MIRFLRNSSENANRTRKFLMGIEIIVIIVIVAEAVIVVVITFTTVTDTVA